MGSRLHHVLALLLLVAITAVSAGTIVAARDETSLAIIDIQNDTWDGTVGLEARGNTVGWVGNAAVFLGTVAAAACSPPATLALPAACGIVGAVAVVGFVFSTAGAILSASGVIKRDLAVPDHTMNGYYTLDQPTTSDGLTVFDRALRQYSEDNSSLPVRLGTTGCEGDGVPCFGLWYEQRHLPKLGRTLHHVHAAPRNFDFRDFAASRRAGSTAPTRVARQADPTETDAGTVTATTGPEYYAGYMFDVGSSGALESCYNVGQSGFVDGIVDQMSGDYSASGKFTDTGTYCMDIDLVGGSSGAATLGYYYFYAAPSGATSGFPTGSESGIYTTCSEEAAD